MTRVPPGAFQIHQRGGGEAKHASGEVGDHEIGRGQRFGAKVADLEADDGRQVVQARTGARGVDRVLIDVQPQDVRGAAQRRGHGQDARSGADIEHAMRPASSIVESRRRHSRVVG